jgi:hypothetical protein
MLGTSPNTTYGSAVFNGTNQTLTQSDTSLFLFDAGNFTIECWVYPTAINRLNGILNNWQGGGEFQWRILSSNNLEFTFTNSASGANTTDVFFTNTIAANVWTHVALVRNSTSLALYLNGVLDAAGAYNIGTQTLYYYNGNFKSLSVGNNGDGAGFFQGRISNMRVVKGAAVYTGNFTVPTSPLSATQSANPYGGSNTAAITGQQTSLLLNTANDASFASDSSTWNLTVVNSNGVTGSSTNPFA